MRVLEVMQPNVITVMPETPIQDAVHLMVVHQIGALPVLDSSGHLLGILSQGDLLRRVELGTELRIPAWLAWLSGPGREARGYVRSHARKVGEVMTAPAISVIAETELPEAVTLMESQRIRYLPVIEQKRLVGILTRSDLIRALDRLWPKTDIEPVSDADLRHRLVRSLQEQRWMPRTSFDVRVRDGVVELVGVITDDRERQAVRVLAENTPGVRSVIDHFVSINPMSGLPCPPAEMHNGA